MQKPAFGNKWLDYHYDYDDPPTQASGSAEPATAADGFRIFKIRDRVPKAPGKWEMIRTAKREKEAAERAKGRTDCCSLCKGLFRSSSQEVGIFVCPKCQSKPKPALDDDVA